MLPLRRATRLPQYLASLYALMIIYASLEPFSGWSAPLPGTPFFLWAAWPQRIARIDFMINVLAYLPFGFLVALIGSARRPSARMVTAVLAASALSAAMETIQMYLPMRDASTVDLAANTIGGFLGGVAGLAFDRVPGLRTTIARWRHRLFLGGRRGDLGLSLLGIWLLAQVNPGIPLFAATFDPSLELTRDVAGTLLQAAQSAFNVIGVGLYVSLLLRQRHAIGGAVLALIGLALLLKGVAASFLMKAQSLEAWLKPGVSLGVATGALLLLLVIWLPRAVRTSLGAIALLASLIAPLIAPDMWQARAPLALFSWPYGHLLNFNGLTHAVLIVWPVVATTYLIWLAAEPRPDRHVMNPVDRRV